MKATSPIRLTNGLLWPVPVTLDVGEEGAKILGSGAALAPRDPEGAMLAVMHVKEVWEPARSAEAECLYSNRPAAPERCLPSGGHSPFFISGLLESVQVTTHSDFQSLRLTPADLRCEFVLNAISRQRTRRLHDCRYVPRTKSDLSFISLG